MLEDSSPGGTPCPIRVAPEPPCAPCAPCARTTHSHTEQRVRGDWTQCRVLSTPGGWHGSRGQRSTGDRCGPCPRRVTG